VGKYETKKMLLPHNLPDGEMSIKRIKRLINTAIELGGVVYEVAADSGLLSAYRFLELQLESDVDGESMLSEDMTVVTEVYVHFPETDELDRIFLYTENAGKDEELKKEGVILAGKLVIEYDRLKSLHSRGYNCVYEKSTDEKIEKVFTRYSRVFGNDWKCVAFRQWDSEAAFIGNGFNRALLARTSFETLLVMPDIYAVEESVKTYYAENLIREKYNASFFIERIPFNNTKIWNIWDEVRKEIFGNFKLEEECQLPEGYKRFIYQAAYIKTYYREVYDTIWIYAYEGDDEPQSISFDVNYATLGISLSGFGGSYGVCLMEDGTIKRVPNMSEPFEAPLCSKYKFKGYGFLENAGVAGSRMALIMKNIVNSAEIILGVTIKRVYVTHVGELPSHDKIAMYMERQRVRAEKRGQEKTSISLIAYKEIEDKRMDGKAVIEWAAELAKLPEFEYVCWPDAIAAAYENSDEKNALKDNGLALLYEFSEDNLCLALMRKDPKIGMDVLWCENIFGPEASAYDESELDEDEYNPELSMVLSRDMEDYMKSAGLSAIGISGENEVDIAAFQELKDSVYHVKNQFRRNDKVKLFFNNGYFSMDEDYPIERLEHYFGTILKNNDAAIFKILERTGFCLEDIEKVYLAGEECEYPFVREHIEELMEEAVCCISTPVCVAARGAALNKKCK